MSGGLVAGFLKGAFLSLVGMSVLSLVSPLEPLDPGQKTQVDLSTPTGSGFNAERTDTNPVLPDTDQSVGAGSGDKPELTDEGSATSGTAPLADTSSAAQPDAQGGVEMPQVLTEDDQVAVLTPSTDDSPVANPPALGVPMPEIGNPVATIPVNRLPTIEPPVTEVDAPPAITEDDTSDVAPTSNEDTPTRQAEVESVQGSSALMRNRVVFANPQDKPLMSVILLDAGDEGLDQEVLMTFRFPITFAIDATSAGATAKAKSLARGGFEILALTPQGPEKLVTAENPADVQAALSAVFAKIPEAVGLVDGPEAHLQGEAGLADQVIAALGQTGHGLLTYDVGLNATDQKALREGLRAGKVFRVLDSERESGAVIKRYLDRAVLEAGKDGHVIVLGRTYPETVTALFSWAISAKSATVALAPISAVLLGR